jgi:alkylhydroperoxidase/carboxymuconolactone decarboxylase family protein YurZ
VKADREEILRRLTLGDVTFLDALISDRGSLSGCACLDPVGESLAKLGALIGTDGSDLTWHQTVAAALDAGVTPDEVVDALVALAPSVGRTRVIAVAPKVALAIGFDVASALEAR